MKLNTKSLKDVESGFPVIADGVYYARLSAETVANKKGTGDNLKVIAKIVDDEVMTHSGKMIPNVGNISVFRYISLVPTDNYDPDRSLKELAVAIGLAPEEDLELENLQGKYVKVKVAYKPAEGGFSEGNDIKGFKFIEPEDAFDPSSVKF